MGCLILLILFLLAYIEISIFIMIASYIGVFCTLLLLIITSCTGLVILRREGLKQLMAMQQGNMFNLNNHNVGLAKNTMFFLAGFLLLIPGFLTDFFALLLLFPPMQHLLMTRWLPYMQRKTYRYQQTKNGRTFEGEYQQQHTSKRENDDPHSLP